MNGFSPVRIKRFTSMLLMMDASDIATVDLSTPNRAPAQFAVCRRPPRDTCLCACHAGQAVRLHSRAAVQRQNHRPAPVWMTVSGMLRSNVIRRRSQFRGHQFYWAARRGTRARQRLSIQMAQPDSRLRTPSSRSHRGSGCITLTSIRSVAAYAWNLLQEAASSIYA